MSSEVIVVESLPQESLREQTERVSVPMTAHDRCRVRRRVQAPDGVWLALALPTGTVLRPGQILHRSESRTYVVTAAPEEVLVVRPRNLVEAVKAGHLVGNLHRDIDVQEDQICLLWDAPLEQRLQREGFRVERVRRPFRGSPASEHSH